MPWAGAEHWLIVFELQKVMGFLFYLSLLPLHHAAQRQALVCSATVLAQFTIFSSLVLLQ